jgi:hypothetical protein
MSFGFSRDDTGAFMGECLDRRILKVGICGEHGGDPASVDSDGTACYTEA